MSHIRPIVTPELPATCGAAVALHRGVRRLVGFNTESESPEDFCEECMDTGWGGDHGPGWRGNNEVGPCDCNQMKRARRNIARRNAKSPNAPGEPPARENQKL